MSHDDEDAGATRVWQSADVAAAVQPDGRRGRSARRERTGGRGPRTGGWQMGWRLILWAVAIGLGWYLGIRYFG